MTKLVKINIYYKREERAVQSWTVFLFGKKFPYWAILHMKRGDTRKKEMWDNKRGEKIDVQQEIIFRQIGAKVALSRIERGKYHNYLSLAMLLKIEEKLQIDPALFLTFNELEKQLWREPLLLEENDEEEK